ncbi:MAG: hypothetical protein QFX37_07410 [Archaeoglobales archaeon]|nr:hypothetical protein [Archaeoglobales archaeon]
MVSQTKVIENLCDKNVESVVETFRDDNFYKVKIISPCPKIQLFAKKIEEMKWDTKQIYELSIYNIWLIAKSFGVKPFCPIPTAVMNAIWLEAGLIAESVALSTTTKFNLSKGEATKLELELPICGYSATITAESTPAKKVKIKIEIPCPDVNKYLAGIENRPIRELEDCDQIYRLSKITDEKTCYIPVAVCIAYAIQSKKLEAKEGGTIVEITMSKS